MQATIWHYDWRSEDRSFNIHFGYLGDCHVLGFPEMADFVISIVDRTIHYYPDQGLAPESLRHFLLDQVLPRSFGQLGKLVLHASSVKLKNGKSVAFLGESGWGKSTLASSFLSSGDQLVSDDCLLIDHRDDKLIAMASYHGVRLFDDSAAAIFTKHPEATAVSHYSSKRRRLVTQPEELGNVIIDAIFLLGDPVEQTGSSEIAIEKTQGSESLMSLIRQLFLLDPLDKKIIAGTFEKLGICLTNGIPVYHLGYPRSYNKLVDVRRAIRDLIFSPVKT